MFMAFLLACSIVLVRSCGEMDITTVFGTVVPGSSPGGSTRKLDDCCASISSERIWFSGKTRPCQGRVGSSILPIRTNCKTAPRGRFALCITGDIVGDSGDKGHPHVYEESFMSGK